MNLRTHFAPLLLLSACLGACGTDSALGRAEQACYKYPTPSARQECEQRAKADDAAYEKEMKRNEAQERAKAKAELQAQEVTDPDAKGEVKKKNGLCFKREATGEMVCPN